MDEGKKKKKKKHHRSKKTENPELKVTTRGEGAYTLVWTHALVQARILNPRVTVVWAPIFHSAPSGYRH